MISEDWGLMTNYENFKILNTEAFLYLLNVNEKLNISKLQADLHFVGVNVDLDYMLEQYHKKNSRQPNTFDECLEALRINMYLTEDGLNLANQILCSKNNTLIRFYNSTKHIQKNIGRENNDIQKRFDWTDKKSARFAS